MNGIKTSLSAYKAMKEKTLEKIGKIYSNDVELENPRIHVRGIHKPTGTRVTLICSNEQPDTWVIA